MEARDVMTQYVMSVGPNESVSRAVRMMLQSSDRKLATAIQQGAPTFVVGLRIAGTRGIRLAGKAHGAGPDQMASKINGRL